MAGWRDSRDYRVWRVAVIRRDKYCQCCGSVKARHAHHLHHATYYPALRFDPANGVTLCDGCHSALHNKVAGGYRKVSTPVHFERLIFLRNYFRRLI